MPDDNRPRILFLMASRTYRAGAFLQAAHALEAAAVVGSEIKHLLTDLNPAGHLHLDFQDLEGLTDRIVEYARSHPIQAVVSPDDDGLALAAMASDALGLSHNSLFAVSSARDKHRMRQVLAENGLPSPWFERFAVDSGPAPASRRVQYPCVLKPLALSGSRGVIRAEDPGQFIAAFGRIASILREPDAALLSGPLAGYILAEGYIPGSEVALEGLMTSGRLKTLAIFDKPDPLAGPFFEETIYVTPSRLEAGLQREIEAAAASAASALGITQGPVHAEMRLNEGGVFVLEIAPRSIGGYCSRALRFEGDESLEMLILRQALGREIESVRREEAASGVMMIPTPSAGILRGISGIEEARRILTVEDVVITIPSGKVLRAPPDGNEYLGFIFSRAPRPEEVETALRTAHACLHVGIEVK
ncbi:MAG TPA: ATP-grasp domain-containing protein [Anaerolineales bacterium]|nr:ATP-grasp domain-containing protein [Anaerolineales bacterium]